MSGVAGLFFNSDRCDGRTLRDAATAMMTAIGHRGPDRSTIKLFDDGFIGHALLTASGDGLAETRGDVAAALDGRIDNQGELAAAMNLEPQSSGAGLIAAAYEKWGLDFADRLTGDFFIAIRDGRNRRLILARDRFGVRPAYYHETANGLAFASEASALLAYRPELARDVSRQALLDYVAGQVSQDVSETIYTNIRRLPPAHILAFDQNGAQLRRYWRLHPIEIRESSAPEQFRDLFTRSVTRRMRTAAPVACGLSGGLDSSSISCVAAQAAHENGQAAPIPAFAMIFDERDGSDERAYIGAVLRSNPNLRGEYIDAGGVEAFADLDGVFTAHSRPPLAPNGATGCLPSYEAGRRLGGSVFLHGHGGDEIVSYGADYLLELAEQQKWLTLWREIDIRSFGAASASRTHYFRTLYLRHSPLAGAIRSIKRAVAAKPAKAPPPYWLDYLARDSADVAELERRYGPNPDEDVWRGLPASQRKHLSALNSPMQASAFEALDHQTARSGVDVRYPFWDKDLVEFCVSLPAHEKWKDGWSRAILRRGLAGVLPDEIAQRRDKFDFTPRLQRSMTAGGGVAIMHRAVHHNAPLIEPYANIDYFQDLLQRLRNGDSMLGGRDLCALWRVTMLSQWLERRA